MHNQNRLAAGVMYVCALGGVAAGQNVLVATDFDADTEGWTVTSIVGANLCGTPGAGRLLPSSFVSEGGDAGGFLRHLESADGRTSFFRAPAVFHSDLSAAYGGVIGWSWRVSSSTFDALEDVYIQGAGMTVWANTPAAGGRWGRAHMPLVEGVWHLSDPSCTSCCSNPGPIATEAELRAVLADVTAVLIRAEHRRGAETVDLDSVAVTLPSMEAAADDFEFGPNGWSILRDAELLWGETFGNDSAGIRGVDDAAGRSFSFLAPERYLADQSDMQGKSMVFDLRSSAAIGGGNSFEDGGNVLVLAGGTTEARFRLDALPIIGDVWRTHAIPLVPSPAWTDPEGTPLAADAFGRVLASVSRVQIRGEYRSGGEVTSLDNVVLGSSSPSVVVSPAGVSVCIGDPLVLGTAVGGEGPFMYQWAKDSVDLVDDAQITGATSSELRFVATGPATPGVYTCRVTNTHGSVTSNAVTVVPGGCCTADLAMPFGTLNFADVQAFLGAFNGELPAADLAAPSGVFNFADVQTFIGFFLQGC